MVSMVTDRYGFSIIFVAIIEKTLSGESESKNHVGTN